MTTAKRKTAKSEQAQPAQERAASQLAAELEAGKAAAEAVAKAVAESTAAVKAQAKQPPEPAPPQSAPIKQQAEPAKPQAENAARPQAAPISKTAESKTAANPAAKPAKPASKRSKTARNPLIVFGNFMFMLAAALILAGAIGLYGLKFLYQQQSGTTEPQALVIASGTGINAIAEQLARQGLISNASVFVYGAYLDDKAKALKAGEYEIPAGASMRDIAEILQRGRSVRHAVTLAEGLTVAQIFAKLAGDSLLTGDLPQELPPEGSLMTDTVNFARGTARRAIVQKLSDGQARLVEQIWARRAADLPLKNSTELVTLASIIEKETGIAAERPRIAAVFYNRLQKNMRLQSDPTVLYGLFGSQGRPSGRPIYRSDLEKDTPYNTYKIFGLPPGPICNPGRESLLAAANPPHTEDLYFVADGTGGHIFAASLSEHNSNVAKWRALKKARQDAAAAEQNTAPEPAETETAPAAETAPKADNAEAASPPPADSAPADSVPSGQSGALPAREQDSASGSLGASGGLIEETP